MLLYSYITCRKYNLNNRTPEDVLADEFWSTEFQEFRWLECKTKCSRGAVDYE
jgi:hypothetical protein